MIHTLREDDEIDIENYFLVGVNGRGEVSFGMPPPHVMSRATALVLAAWLVAVADQDERFGEILNRVRNT